MPELCCCDSSVNQVTLKVISNEHLSNLREQNYSSKQVPKRFVLIVRFEMSLQLSILVEHPVTLRARMGTLKKKSILHWL
jgi:hypothetical protein